MGNIRELRNYVERCVAYDAVVPLRPDELETEIPIGPSTFPAARDAAQRAFEREYLVQLMRDCDGKLAEAASRAGIGRVYLYKLLVRNGLK
jgi:two-component system, NtrC family, response regulator GlrR